MKKITITFILLVFSFLLNTTNAASIPILWASTTSQYAWKVVFPLVNGVYANTDAFIVNNISDIQISWNFWLQNLSSATDLTLWWATFDIWIVAWAPKVVLKNNLDNTFTFSWYAWSKAAWWIYFSPVLLKDSSNNDIQNSKVVYNRWANDWKWEITGCAWSQNIWWVCFDWITLDTTPPHFPGTTWLSMVTSADYNKSIILNEQSTVKIQNWNSTSISTYTTDSLFRFNHDMRNALNPSRYYSINATDIFWNSATWIITIVANIPDTNLSVNNIWWVGVQSTTYGWTLWSEKISDWKDYHSLDIRLRDTYWNPIVTVTWIKDVKVTLWFSNNLDKIQVWTETNLGDAIKFENSDWPLLFWWIWSTEDTIRKSDWNYKVAINSLAPSKAGYSYTNANNDIQVNNLDIAITALNWNSWVWEWPINDIHTSYYPNPFKFTPTIKIDWVSNNTNWVIHRDYETEFTITWSTNKSSWSPDLTGIHITHLFDTMSWSTYTNNQISYQNLTWSISQTTCTWSNTSAWYYFSHTDCDRSSILPYSSNTIRLYNNVTSTNSSINDIVSTIPRLVNAWLSSFDTKYSSIVSYIINWNNIKYPSYTTTSSLINNSQIKISWIVNKNNNNFAVVADSSINYIWNILKSDVYTMIHKNVSLYQKAWNWTADTLYMTWNYTLPSLWPTWIETIIVDWWDVIIWSDITKILWKVKTIIALKKSDWTKWNIWIKHNIQFIWATLIADRSVLSWDWTTYYTDTNSATNQLFIKWSVISYNTIWWSSKNHVICPYYITTICDLVNSRRYDFNHFRSYINWISWNAVNWSTYWVNMSITWYVNAPMIIEYDSDTQKNPPKIIKK